MPEIVYLDTYFITGHYAPNLDRIELSAYLKDYPELHDFVLAHEKKHGEIGGISWRHFIVDVRDRYRFFTDKVLWDQYCAFVKHREPINLSQHVFTVLYHLVNALTAFFVFFTIKHIPLRKKIALANLLCIFLGAFIFWMWFILG